MYKPERIFVDPCVSGLKTTKGILEKFPDTPVLEIKRSDIDSKLLYDMMAEPKNEAVGNLFIAQHRGRCLKHCPCSKDVVCCGYHIMNIYANCFLDCTYCVMQSYINSPFLTIFANIEDILYETEKVISGNADRFYRVGTGELSDSLAMDHITGFSDILISFFARQKNAVLELKTKTNNISILTGLVHNRKTIISWSLNPEKIIREEEQRTASLNDRIDAAVKCQEAGYLTGFHLDPIIFYEGWQKDYRGLIELMLTRLDPKKIVWISLGMLRFPQSLKGIISERSPESRLVTGEIFRGIDGKMRYLKGIRKGVYQNIISWILELAPDAFIYFCMENSVMWEKTLGWSPLNKGHIDSMFIRRLEKLKVI